MADSLKNAIVPTDQLLKIKGGSNDYIIIIEDPIP